MNAKQKHFLYRGGIFFASALYLFWLGLNSVKSYPDLTGNSVVPVSGIPSCATSTCHHHGDPIANPNTSIQIKWNGTAVSSYVSGVTYDVTFRNSDTSFTRYGFQVAASAGQFLSTNSSTLVSLDGSYINHSQSATQQSSWNFKWKAPTGSNQIAFNSAGVWANSIGTHWSALSTLSIDSTTCSYQLQPSSQPNAPFSGGGGTVNVAGTPNECTNWTATENGSTWIHLNSINHTNNTVQYSVDPNLSTDSRSGTLTIGGQTFSITQQPKPCQLALNPVSVADYSSDGGPGGISVTSDCKWNPTGYPDWIKINSFDATSLSYTVKPNPNLSRRDSKITIGSKDFLVGQLESVISLGERRKVIEAPGEPNGFVPVVTNNYTVWNVSTSFSWIKITSLLEGNVGSGRVTFSVEPNLNKSQRIGSILIGIQTLEIVQSGVSCHYSIVPPLSQNFESPGGEGQIPVNAEDGCEWTASVPAGIDWILLTGGVNSVGNAVVKFKVLENKKTESRTAYLDIAGQDFAIAQNASGCSYTITLSSQTLPASGGTGSFEVDVAGGCSWTASTQEKWITINSGGNGNGKGTVQFMVSATDTPEERHGSISVSGKTFSIDQEAFPLWLDPLDPASKMEGDVGFTMVLTGKNFKSDAKVLWNGAPRDSQVISDTKLQFQISDKDLASPAETSIVVSQDGLTSNIRTLVIQADLAPPQISSFLPVSGSTLGNTPVFIEGDHFRLGSVSTPPGLARQGVEAGMPPSETAAGAGLYLDGKPLTGIQYISKRSLRAITPSGTEGLKDFSITNEGGSVATLPAAFTYRTLPPLPPPGSPQQVRWYVPYIIDSAEFRTDLGINNLDSDPAQLNIFLVDRNGLVLSKGQETVEPHGSILIENVVQHLEGQEGMTGREGYLVIDSISKIRAWASQIDQLTTDPAIEMGQLKPAAQLLIPYSASDDQFSSSLAVVNGTASSGMITLHIISESGEDMAPVAEFSIAGNGYLYLNDLFKSLGIASGTGWIRVEGPDPIRLFATERIARSHYSGFLDGIDVSSSSKTVTLPFLADDVTENSLGITNPNPAEAEFTVNLVMENGKKKASLGTQVVAPGGLIKLDDLAKQLLGDDSAGTVGTLQVVSSKPVLAWLIRSDSQAGNHSSKDPSFLLARPSLAARPNESTRLQVPFVTNKENRISTLFIGNRSNRMNYVVVEIRDQQGEIKGHGHITLSPQGSYYFPDLLEQFNLLDFSGSITLYSQNFQSLWATSTFLSKQKGGSGFVGLP